MVVAELRDEKYVHPNYLRAARMGDISLSHPIGVEHSSYLFGLPDVSGLRWANYCWCGLEPSYLVLEPKQQHDG